MRPIALFACAAALALHIFPKIAAAQIAGRIYVLESSAPAVQAGKEYAADDTLHVPAGASIRAVMPSGKTQTVRGPYSGPVREVAKGQGMNERVFAWIKSFLETGGATDKLPGAARGVRSASPLEAFSWSAVPTHGNSIMCAPKGGVLQLVRDNPQAAGRITVVDIESAQKGEARWAKGSASTEWPAALAVRQDATYTLLVPGQEPRDLTLRILDRVPDEEDVLSELATRGCRHQFDAWMKHRTKSS